ncbi:MAG TPA: diguanylate cyclase [Bdellovibrionales bacterium]|nr:diguanylate cyclase [Bdellovibrionales bacterium]
MTLDVRPRRVLVVDDDNENCKLIHEALTNEGFDVRTANSGHEAMDVLTEWSPQLVLLDQDMPGMTGLETLRMLRKGHYDVDVMFVSANLSPKMVSDALEAGADDYIRKPFSFRELCSRVKVRFRIRDLRDDLQGANQKLFELSQRDDLTGLYNMRSMYERIDHELRRAKRTNKSVSCVMMDMDYFKTVNDGHDHLFGSFVLKEVGSLIKNGIREVDFAARYGGDEFLVVLCDTDQEGTKIFTERLRKTVQNHFFTDGKDGMKLTISIGYAVSTLGGETTARDLVRIADHALYEAKERGRNRVFGFGCDEVMQRLGQLRKKKSAA